MAVTLGTYGATDATGWTVITQSTGKIVYVASAASGGSNSNTGLTVGDPVLTLAYAKGLLTDNQSDWMLLKEGDTWTDQSIGYIGKSGKNANEPMVFGSYDPAQPGVLSPGTAARPIIKMNQAVDGAPGIGSLGNLPLSGNYVAVIGIDFYNYTRDPANIGAGFSATNGSMLCIAFTTEHAWLLIEGCMLRFGADNIDLDMPTGLFSQNTYFRRNTIVDSWSNQGLSQGIHAVRNFDDFLIEECLFDRNGWNEVLITPATVTLTIASPCVVTWASNPLYDNTQLSPGARVTFHNNGDTLPTGLSFATQYFVVSNGTDGAGKFRLSLTSGGAAINTTGSQSGTHKLAWDGDSAPVITGFNHNVYMDTNNAPLTFRGNIVARGAVSFENRIGGTTFDNLFCSSSDSGFVSGSGSVTTDNVITGEQVNSYLGITNGINQIAALNCTFSGNLIVNSTGGTLATDTRSGGEQAHDDAVRFTLANPCVASFRTSMIWEGQPYVFHSDTGGTPPASIVFGTTYYARNPNIPDGDSYDGTCNLSLTPTGALISTASQSQSGLFGYDSLSLGCVVTGNTVYNWGSKATNMTVAAGNTLTDNQDYDLGDTLPGSWTDATRDVSSYNSTVLGGAATLAAFLTSARAQRKGNWNANLTAPVVNDWIRAGFGDGDGDGGEISLMPQACM